MTNYAYLFTYVGDGSVYIIVGAVIGVIIVLSLLIIIIVCCFMRRKGMYVCCVYDVMHTMCMIYVVQCICEFKSDRLCKINPYGMYMIFGQKF